MKQILEACEVSSTIVEDLKARGFLLHSFKPGTRRERVSIFDKFTEGGIYFSYDGIQGGLLAGDTPAVVAIMDCLRGVVERDQVPLLLAKLGDRGTGELTHYRQLWLALLRACYCSILEV